MFQQRHDADSSLLLLAEACSLVYSFDGETIAGPETELSILGGLVGRSGDVFRAAKTLKARNLLQTRGPWCAVLPHAIANRLAASALENVPAQTLQAQLVDGAPIRLVRSFSRRLGYLDTSPEARIMVERWLAPGGLLEDLVSLDEHGRAVLDNVAPVVPDATLTALEKALTRADEGTMERCRYFLPLLRSLAYEARHFDRAAALLMLFVRLPTHEGREEAAKVIESLFTIVFSGTLASLAHRLTMVERLMGSSDAAEQRLGVRALEAMLKTDDFSPRYGFEFGARSRSYGSQPRTGQEARDWFAATLSVAESFALSDHVVAEPVRVAVARQFQGLWRGSGAVEALERLSRTIAAQGFWREGWLAARHTRIHARAGLAPEPLERLGALEHVLSPKTLVEQVSGLVLGANDGRFELDDMDDAQNEDYAAAEARAAAAVETLGRDVAAGEEALQKLLPALIGGGGRVVGFGKGIALGTDAPLEVWRAMVAQLAVSPTPSVDLLGGFLQGLRQRGDGLVDTFRDEAMDDPRLAQWFPLLQAHLVIDARAVARLLRVLERASAPIGRYAVLAFGLTSEATPGEDIERLVLAIAGKPNGTAVAREILFRRLFADQIARRRSVPEIVRAGRALLASYSFSRYDDPSGHENYQLGWIIRATLVGEKGRPIARQLCRVLIAAVAESTVSAHEYRDVVHALFHTHPVDVLDELFTGDVQTQHRSVHFIQTLSRFKKNPLEGIADDVIIGWCDVNALVRYPPAAAVALLFERPDNQVPHRWTSLTGKLLLRAPDPEAVLREVVIRLDPTSWGGSLATKLESRIQLLDQLDVNAIQRVTVHLSRARAQLMSRIERERRREADEDKARSERFE